MADHRQALQALARVPLANFVAERKRLAAKLRASGDGDAATDVARRRRPTASVWAVNQLYWDERTAFDALLATATRIRKGDLGETGAYRTALARLRERATAILHDAGHAPTPTILRRVTGTLAALAAAGGFDPDPPGALAADREPPGFDAVGVAAATPTRAARPGAGKEPGRAAPAVVPERKRRAATQAEERARRQAQAKARAAERDRLKAALREASAEVGARERAVSLRQRELRAAEQAVDAAREVLRELERKLADAD